jgi:hypothetical protein
MDYTKTEYYVFSIYNPKNEYFELSEEEKEILEVLTQCSTFGKLLLKTKIDKVMLTFALTRMLKKKIIKGERLDYPCIKCKNKCCRLGNCSTFPCDRIKEGCNKLYDCVVKEKAKGRIK